MWLAVPGQVLSDGIMQALVLFPHREPVAWRQVVKMHGDLYYRPIQCEENVEHRVGVVPDTDING